MPSFATLTNWLWPTPAAPQGLNLDAFPHILDAILDEASLPALLTLRQTCRGMKERVDARFAHLVAGPDGSLRAIPSTPSSYASPILPSDAEDDTSSGSAGIDLAPIVDAWCRSAALGPSTSWFGRPQPKVKPFIFATARYIDRYHCPGRGAEPCKGEDEDGCGCACAPVRGLVHFDAVEAMREWRCPPRTPEEEEEKDMADEEETMARPESEFLSGYAWSLSKQLRMSGFRAHTAPSFVSALA